MRLAGAVSGIVLSVSSASALAGVCDIADTPPECSTKIKSAIDNGVRNAQAEAQDLVGQNLVRRVTGTSPSIPQSANGTVNDFLSKFQFSLDSGELNDDSESLTFELSDFLPAVDGLKLALSLNSAEPFEPLLEVAPVEQRETIRRDISQSLGDFDNVRISFSYSLSNEKYGRNHQNHAQLLSTLVDASFDKEKSRVKNQATGEYDELVRVAERRLRGTTPAFDADNGPFTQYEDSAQELLAAFERSENAELSDLNALVANLNGNGFYKLVELIDNQPQFYIQADFSERAEFAGPDALSVKVAYEMGLHNVNALKRHASRSATCGRSSELSESTILIPCIEEYLNKIGDVDNGRFVFSGQFTRRQSYGAVFMGANPIEFNQPSHNDIELTAAYGRYISGLGVEKTGARFDVGLSYINVDGDPMKNDRAFIEATLSRRVSEATFLALGLVYSNKPEFRGTVDNELSARLGFNYKISSFSQD